MKTLKEWTDSKLNFEGYVKPGDEIDGDLYWYFMEVLPPVDIGKNFFLLGEAISHDENGRALYSLFVECEGRFYFKGSHTRVQVRALVMDGLL